MASYRGDARPERPLSGAILVVDRAVPNVSSRPMTAPVPWELDAVLQPSRLLLLAQHAVETRNQTFLEARPDLGDTS